MDGQRASGSPDEPCPRPAREEQVGEQSLQRADIFLQEENYGKAFAHYFLGLQLLPSHKQMCRQSFVLAAREWGEQLARDGELEHLFVCYEQASSLFPNCHELLNTMGSQLFRLGYIDEAACYFRRALQIQPDFLSARENLDNICGHLVERWHFRMLNDTHRNQAYHQAIMEAVRDGHQTVLDIGAGTGLLSMFAVQANASEVFACEMTKAMYEVSCDVIKANNMDDQIEMIHKMSTDLIIPQDLPQKVDLVVTETFDAGLLGEHILDTLSHAWSELMEDNEDVKASVIPCGATVYICAVEAEDIRRNNRMLYPGVRNLDLSGINILCQTSTGQGSRPPTEDDQDSPSAGFKGGGSWFHPHPGESPTGCGEEFIMEPEPYTTERLDTLPAKYKLLTDAVRAFTFNFTDLQSLSQFQQGISHHQHLEIRKQGHLDAIVMWFDLDLTPTVTLSSAPGVAGCWEQAVFPVLPIHLASGLTSSSIVETGNILDVECSCFNNSLHFFVRQVHRQFLDKPTVVEPLLPVIQSLAPTNGYMDSTSLWDPSGLPSFLNSNHTSPACDTQLHIDIHNHHSNGLEGDSNDLYLSHKLQQQTLGPLNNGTCEWDPRNLFFLERHELALLNDIDLNAANWDAIRAIKDSEFGDQDWSLLELAKSVSLVPLQACDLGAAKVATTQTSPVHQRLLTTIATRNGIDCNKVRWVEPELNSVERCYDVLVADVVDPMGCLHQQVLHDIAIARYTCLKPGGIMMPSCVAVYGMVIDSVTLLQDSALVSDTRTLYFKVAKYINDFQMKTHVDIDLSILEYKKLSEPVELFRLDLNEPLDGNQVPAFLEQTRTFKVPVINIGEVTAVVYWFELCLHSDVKVCTLDRKLHWRQAAVMQKRPMNVLIGGELNVKAVCKNSCIDIEVSLPDDS